MELETLPSSERLVADEVVERLSETTRDQLKRADRWADESGLELADEALGELLAGDLRLAQPKLAACRTHALTERGGHFRSLDLLTARSNGH
jgi:hypothetical protein